MTDSKIALITGASRGLGRAMTKQLSRSGTRVIGTYRTGREEALALADELDDVVVLPLDVTDFGATPASSRRWRRPCKPGSVRAASTT